MKRKKVFFWAGIACSVFAFFTNFGGWGEQTREPMQAVALALIALALFKACELSDEV